MLVGWTTEEVSLLRFCAWKVIWKFGWVLCSSHHFLRLWKTYSCLCVHDGIPLHTKKTHKEESLIYVYNYHPLHRQKRSQNGREFIFAVCGATSSLNDQSLIACPWYFLRERHDPSFETWPLVRDWLSPVWTVCTLPSRSLLCLRLRKSSWRWDPLDSTWYGLIPPWLTVTLTITQVLPTNGANCKDRVLIPGPRGKWIQAQ